ncbi:sprT domain-containing protein [Acutalibacter sp. 1XD8-33]|uniref:SprT-like domain-containing protein n=1 Tax=Acutalibacter sp. 1XD8-33 TaxID=2320081 RepID=UPI000EA22E7B|nr:SprT-like domain-containing protein [Acutalibacter sp. 1XD8-33]RKJ40344.1 sprT domain-containing protein [Acutalibacter sp. 1XD8-33]
MEQKDLDETLAQMWEILKKLGIPVSKKIQPVLKINTRAKRRLGCCFFQNGEYSIEISSILTEDEPLLRQTLAHELLHTCPGCRNHGERWKAYAQIVNQSLDYEISRTVQMQELPLPLRREEVKYVLECESCGAHIQRKRLSKAVKYPWRYRCPCGGKLKRIQ